MRPAISVIFFTTVSGAGYGLLILLGVATTTEVLPYDKDFQLTVIFSGLGLVTAGLIASTFHLGHPERAWRALSQWRSSWLSREGVFALFTYVPALILMFGWLFSVSAPSLYATLGVIIALLALATVFSTSMIYACLKPIPAWNNFWVPTSYVLFALTSGAVILNTFLICFGEREIEFSIFVSVLAALTLITKVGYWRFIDSVEEASTSASALGLSTASSIELVQSPHSETNYLQREMIFKVARDHASKLRMAVLLMGLISPAVLTLISASRYYVLAIVTAILAVLLLTIGAFVERWLFFAEAKHTVRFYYPERNRRPSQC